MADVSLFGSGEGANPARDTILDATGTGGRVLLINEGGGPVVLQRLSVMGGTTSTAGAGILHLGTTLEMTECAVGHNTAMDAPGGGLSVGENSTLEMTRCWVGFNHATVTGNGGGIATSGTTTLTDCLIVGNQADNLGGGILLNENGPATLAGATTVQGNEADVGGGIYADGSLHVEAAVRITANTATSGAGGGGGIFRSVDVGTVTLDAGSLVCGNTPDQCVGFNDPNACQANCPS
jgi:hypothetical protein